MSPKAITLALLLSSLPLQAGGMHLLETPSHEAQAVQNPELIKALKALQSEDAEIRADAVVRLGELGDKSAVPTLVQVLKDKNDDVRSAKASLYAFEISCCSYFSGKSLCEIYR